MRTEQGSIHDSRAIAAIYAEAFPHSTRFFFRKKKPERLSGLLELTFNLVFLWGRTSNRGQKRPGGQLLGYCLYSTGRTPNRALGPAIATAFRLLFRIGPSEALLLTGNQLLMIFRRAERAPNGGVGGHALFPSPSTPLSNPRALAPRCCAEHCSAYKKRRSY